MVTGHNTASLKMENNADSFSSFQSRELALKLVEPGHKASVLRREEFLEKKAAAQAAKSHTFYSNNQPMTLASAGKELQDNFLKALAEREEANRSGKMTSVIFIRDHNPLGQEVSGYIDYAHRLMTQDFEPYFSRKKRLMPGHSDLSYYNWKTQVCTSNSSPNFQVICDDPDGLFFKSKRDRKVLSVDPWPGIILQPTPLWRRLWPGAANKDSNRTFLQSDLYIHVVIYDHDVRTV